MTDLSPQAQAVLDDFEIASDGHYDDGEWVPHIGKQLAAALRAAVDQANPKLHIEDIDYQHQLYVDGWKDALDLILVIADKMEQLND